MTHLGKHQQAMLDVVRHHATAAAAAELSLRGAVLDAIGAGVPVSRIADAAGVNRATVFRWRQEASR